MASRWSKSEMRLGGCDLMKDTLGESLANPIFAQEGLYDGNNNYIDVKRTENIGQITFVRSGNNGSNGSNNNAEREKPIISSSSHSVLHSSSSCLSPSNQDSTPLSQNDWTSLISSSLGFNLGPLYDTPFQYILNASTTPCSKINEESLTYLNQGQSYELKLKKLGDSKYSDRYLKGVIRIIFHERRLQYMEREQLDTWRSIRPGERILDIDIPLSYGLVDVQIDLEHLSSLEFVWDSQRESSGVCIKLNAISTEFTARRHGGEKGVPFRIQVETYTIGSSDITTPSKLIHCASCQVKVFKPKGADRKYKTDRDKIDKKSETEKEKYQPSFECTVLTEISLDQVKSYLEQLQNPTKSLPTIKQSISEQNFNLKMAPHNFAQVGHDAFISDNHFNHHGLHDMNLLNDSIFDDVIAVDEMEDHRGVNVAEVLLKSPNFFQHSPFMENITNPLSCKSQDMMSIGGGEIAQDEETKHVAYRNIKLSSSSNDNGILINNEMNSDNINNNVSDLTKKMNDVLKEATNNTCSSSDSSPASPFEYPREFMNVTSSMSTNDVYLWLKINRFEKYANDFLNFSGSDLLRLNKTDLIQICGCSDGIRLHNSLNSKPIPPKLTLYIYNKGKWQINEKNDKKSNMNLFRMESNSPNLGLSHNGDSGESKKKERGKEGKSKSRKRFNIQECSEFFDKKSKSVYDAFELYAIYLKDASVGSLNSKLSRLVNFPANYIKSIFYCPINCQASIIVDDAVIEKFPDQIVFDLDIHKEDDDNYEIILKGKSILYDST